MSKLEDAIKEKFGTKRNVLKALGLDESLLEDRRKETEMTKPTKFANLALQLTARSIRPMLAKDAKVDLMPIFKDVTTKNFNAKNIRLALDSALKGKLAKDADPHMGHVAQMLDHLEEARSPETADESVSEAQHKAMGAAAGGHSNLGIPEKVGKEFAEKDKGKWDELPAWLKEKGATDEEVERAMDAMLPKNALAGDESEEEEEEKKKREKEAKDKAAKDAEMEKEDKEAERNAEGEDHARDAVSKPAMDAAIKAATELTAKKVKAEVIETQRAIRKAEAAIEPYVGKLASDMTFDTADEVYAAALKMRGVDVKDVHSSAYPKLLELLPKAGARPASARIAQDDSSALGGFATRHPDVARITSI